GSNPLAPTTFGGAFNGLRPFCPAKRPSSPSPGAPLPSIEHGHRAARNADQPPVVVPYFYGPHLRAASLMHGGAYRGDRAGAHRPYVVGIDLQPHHALHAAAREQARTDGSHRLGESHGRPTVKQPVRLMLSGPHGHGGHHAV